MESLPASHEDIFRPVNNKKKELVAALILLLAAIVLIVISIIRNELRVVELDKNHSLMLKKICEATVTNC